MKALQYITSESIIALDIETVRIKEHYSDLDEETKRAWKTKNKNEGVIPTEDELSDLWTRTASQWAEFAKICCISVAYQLKEKLYVKCFASADEVGILREFSTFADAVQSRKGDWRFVGHAMGFFDVPFICKRYIINYMPPPEIIDESGEKPWLKDVLDTNKLWKSFGEGTAGSSLDALCNALQIPSPKVDLAGDEVGKAYYNGELVRISDYCNLDAIATYNIVRRFKLEPIFKPEDIVYQNQGELIVSVPLLEAIRNSKNITAPQKKEIANYCATISKDEVSSVKRILRAAVTNDEGKVKPTLEKLIESL